MFLEGRGRYLFIRNDTRVKVFMQCSIMRALDIKERFFYVFYNVLQKKVTFCANNDGLNENRLI